MSTEVQPPASSSFPRGSPSPPRNTSFRKPPPAAYDMQPTQRRHSRSASFGDLVSRILPSRRQEKGYTLRERYKDGDQYDAVDLVFGLVDAPDTVDDGGLPRKTNSRSPRKDGGVEARDDRNMKKQAYSKVGSGRPTTTGGVIKQRKLSWLFRPLVPLEEGDKVGQDERIATNAPQPSRRPSLPTRAEGSGRPGPRIYETYKNKKSRKDQRRKLQASGDFLGVQGANPRTGYWDISDTTSSSDPTQMVLDFKKREKARQIKREVKMQQRRSKRWRLNEAGWSSVAEPGLSPIEQSLAGSPAKESISPGRFVPMPNIADIEPHEPDSPFGPQGYPGQWEWATPSPRQHVLNPTNKLLETPSPLHPNITIRRKPVNSPRKHIRDDDSLDTIVIRTPNSSKTTKTVEARPEPHQTEAPLEIGDLRPRQATSQKGEHFLGKWEPLPAAPKSGKTRAIAISYRSVMAKQVQINPPSALNQQISFRGGLVSSVSDLPPVSLKDPLRARIPLSFQAQRDFPQIWASRNTPKAKPGKQILSTSIPTTITTGYLTSAPRPSLPLDGPGFNSQYVKTSPQMRRPLSRRHSPRRRRSSRVVPLRRSSLRNKTRNRMQNEGRPARAVDIVISSEPRPNQVRYHPARFCETVSPGHEKAERKSTRISTSTSPSPRRPVKPRAGRHLIRLAIKHPQHLTTSTTSQSNTRGLSLEKGPRQMTEVARGVNIKMPIQGAPEGGDDIGDPFMFVMTKGEVRSENRAARLAVWHAAPGTSAGVGCDSAGKHQGEICTTKKAVMVTPNQTTGASPATACPRPGWRRMSIIGQSIIGFLQVACWSWIIGPWLELERDLELDTDVDIGPDVQLPPSSAAETRKRWKLQVHHPAWPDISLFVSMALLSAVIYLLAALLIRMLGMCLHVARTVIGVLQHLTGC